MYCHDQKQKVQDQIHEDETVYRIAEFVPEEQDNKPMAGYADRHLQKMFAGSS